MDDLTPPREMARRVRAAIGYAGLDVPELAKRTGIPKGTLYNITSDSRPSGATEPRIAVIIAECEGVPPNFMAVGFDPLRQPMDDVTRDLYILRAEVERRLAALEAATPAETLADVAKTGGQQRPGKHTKPAASPQRPPKKGQAA